MYERLQVHRSRRRGGGGGSNSGSGGGSGRERARTPSGRRSRGLLHKPQWILQNDIAQTPRCKMRDLRPSSTYLSLRFFETVVRPAAVPADTAHDSTPTACCAPPLAPPTATPLPWPKLPPLLHQHRLLRLSPPRYVKDEHVGRLRGTRSLLFRPAQCKLNFFPIVGCRGASTTPYALGALFRNERRGKPRRERKEVSRVPLFPSSLVAHPHVRRNLSV